MAENLGRVNPVLRHFLDRGGREEPYHGRHPKRHPGPRENSDGADPDRLPEDGTGHTAARNHIDLRI